MQWIVQLVAALVIGLLKWLEERHAQSKNAIEARRSADTLSRIGDRVRAWEDRARSGRQSATDGTGDDGTGLPPHG